MKMIITVEIDRILLAMRVEQSRWPTKLGALKIKEL